MIVYDVPETIPRNMTFEVFLEWARTLDETFRAELVEGEVEFMRPLSVAHQQLGRFLLTILSMLVGERQLGEVFYENFLMKVGVRTGREPDILFVASENLHRLRDNYLDGPADLVIEIVSPESQTRDRIIKKAEYERRGVREYWVLDPSKTEALFYQLQGDGVYLLVPPDTQFVYRSLVVPGFWVHVDWFWQRPLPSQTDVLRQWGVV